MKYGVGLLALGVALATPWPARADPLKLLVAVSNSNGAAGESPLHHAADDTERVRAVFTTLGGVLPGDAIVLADPTVPELDAALDRARARAATHAQDEVTFVFYFSGHGDQARIHLGGESLDMTELAARVRTVPAGLRVLVTDACRTYPTRLKGITSEPGFAITPREANAGTGMVWLYASGEGEPAQESDELRGALFTHYWVSALRGAGDTNGDGRITVAESYDFAYSQTLLRSASGSGVLQHPAATFELREAAPIVLTDTQDGATRVRFPRTDDTRFLVYALGSRAVLGEIWGSADRDATLALPPGRYLIQRRNGASSAGVEVTLARGETRTLTGADFRSIATEQLASKGGEVVLRPNELSLGAGLRTSRLASFGGEVRLEYAHSWGPWALGIGLAAAEETETTSAEHVRLDTLGGEATLERRWRKGPWTLSLGGGAEVDLVWEKLTRTDAAIVALAGYSTTHSYEALAPGPLLVARGRYSFTPKLWTELSVRGSLLIPELDGSVGALWGGQLGAGVGMSF